MINIKTNCWEEDNTSNPEYDENYIEQDNDNPWA